MYCGIGHVRRKLGAAFFGGLTYADPYLSRAEVFRNCFYLLTSVLVAGVPM